MSTMYQIKTIEYTKRKPSRKMIMRDCIKALERGYGALNVMWGENCIEITFNTRNCQYYGTGWIKEISGDSIAEGLNKERAHQTMQLNTEKHIYQFNMV